MSKLLLMLFAALLLISIVSGFSLHKLRSRSQCKPLGMVMISEQVTLTGKHRRILRAIANRMKSNNEMSTLQYSGKTEQDDGAFIENLKSILIAHELVAIKTKVEKRKLAKAIGEKLAVETDSNLVQVVGHTILLYQASPYSTSEVTKAMLKELAAVN